GQLVAVASTGAGRPRLATSVAGRLGASAAAVSTFTALILPKRARLSLFYAPLAWALIASRPWRPNAYNGSHRTASFGPRRRIAHRGRRRGGPRAARSLRCPALRRAPGRLRPGDARPPSPPGFAGGRRHPG